MFDNSMLDDYQTERKRPRVLFGKYGMAGTMEHLCSVVGLTIDGAVFKCSALPPFGAIFVAQLEHVGRIEGRAINATEDGFVAEWCLSPAQRTALASKLIWLEDFYNGDIDNERQYSRRPLDNANSTMTLLDGRRFPCTISDVSMSGAAVHVQQLPEVGSRLYLGSVLCEVVRYTGEGVGVRFLTGFGSDLIGDLLSGAADG